MEEPPVPVTVVVAAPDVISRTVQAPCRLEAGFEAVLTVPVPSRIEDVMVSEGDTVRQGDTLVRLASDDSYEAALGSAAAMVTAARSAYGYAGDNLSRASDLFEAGALSPSDYDAAVAAAEAARAALEGATAGYEAARAAGGSGIVSAPFDGRVTRVMARPGNTAAGPLLAVAGDGVLRAELLVAERHLPWVREGLPASFTSAHFPGEVFQGEVVSASASVDPLSGLVPLTVQLPDTSGRLVPGLSGMVTVALETSEDALVLPGRALIATDGGGWNAALVRGGTVTVVPVETGIRQGNSWEVISGVEFGDSVVVLGNHLVSDGTRVEAVGR